MKAAFNKMLKSNVGLVSLLGLASCQPVSLGNWSLISGSNVLNQQANYGTVNLPSIQNQPGGRMCHAAVFDSITQVMYVFAGNGYAADGSMSSFGSSVTHF